MGTMQIWEQSPSSASKTPMLVFTLEVHDAFRQATGAGVSDADADAVHDGVLELDGVAVLDDDGVDVDVDGRDGLGDGYKPHGGRK